MKEVDVAHADGADRIAMIGELQMDKCILGAGRVSLLPVLDGHFERDFHRRRSIVRVKHSREAFGSDPNQGSREFYCRWIGEPEQRGMCDLIQLRGDRMIERGCRCP